MPGNVYHHIDIRDGNVLAGDQYVHVSAGQGSLRKYLDSSLRKLLTPDKSSLENTQLT